MKMVFSNQFVPWDNVGNKYIPVHSVYRLVILSFCGSKNTTVMGFWDVNRLWKLLSVPLNCWQGL